MSDRVGRLIDEFFQDAFGGTDNEIFQGFVDLVTEDAGSIIATLANYLI